MLLIALPVRLQATTWTVDQHLEIPPLAQAQFLIQGTTTHDDQD